MFTRLRKLSRHHREALRPTPEALAERSPRSGHPTQRESRLDEPELGRCPSLVHPLGLL